MRIYIHVLSKSINKELFPSLFCFLCSYACVEELDFLTTTTAKMLFRAAKCVSEEYMNYNFFSWTSQVPDRGAAWFPARLRLALPTVLAQLMRKLLGRVSQCGSHASEENLTHTIFIVLR